MSKQWYIGIDPGASGGLAVLRPGFDVAAEAVKMPATEADILAWIKAALPPPYRGMVQPVFACIEQVGGYISGNALPGSAMFRFGMGYGGLRMAMTALGIPFEAATPQKWQKALGIPPRKPKNKPGGETDVQWKNRLKAAAQRLYPSLDVTLQTADALLISTYCQRLREGKLG